jgi:hypothetical protein
VNKTAFVYSLAAMVISPLDVLAQSVPFNSALPDGGTLDNLLAHIVQTTSGWMDKSLAIGSDLFYLLAGLTGIVVLCRYYMENHTLEGVVRPIMAYYATMIPLIVTLGCMTTFLPKLIDNSELLATDITGTSISSPSGVIQIGTGMAVSILHSTGSIFASNNGAKAPGSVPSIVDKLTSANPASIESAISPVGFNAPVQPTPNIFLQAACGVIGVFGAAFVLFAFTVIAFQLFFVQANVYITLGICALSLGWMGSPATKHMAESYMGAAWKSVLNLVLTIACISLIDNMVPTMKDMSASTDPGTMLTTILLLCSSSIFSVLLAWKLPNHAVNLLTGNPSIGAMEAAGVMGRMLGRR